MSYHVHQPPARLPAAEGNHWVKDPVRAGFKAQDPRMMWREAWETSQQSQIVSEWEGEQKRGNT